MIFGAGRSGSDPIGGWTRLFTMGTLLAALCASADASATHWISSETYDDVGDEVRHVAAVEMPDGHFFGVYRTDGEEGAWLVLGLPEGTAMQFSTQLFPEFRVDSRQPLDTSLLTVIEELGGQKLYHRSPTVYYFHFPRIDGMVEGRGFLYDLIVGNELKVRYWLTDGSAVRIDFPLTGSKAAILAAFAFNHVATSREAARNGLLNDKRSEYMFACGETYSPHVEGATNPNDNLLKICLEHVEACASIVVDEPERFGSCMSTHAEIVSACAEYVLETRRSSDEARDVCTEVRLNEAFPNYRPYSLDLTERAGS